MLENLMDKYKKIQFHTGYFHVAIITKHKDVNAMPNSDQIYYASINIIQTPHRDPTTHS
jgi:hypothetical protein